VQKPLCNKSRLLQKKHKKPVRSHIMLSKIDTLHYQHKELPGTQIRLISGQSGVKQWRNQACIPFLLLSYAWQKAFVS